MLTAPASGLGRLCTSRILKCKDESKKAVRCMEATDISPAMWCLTACGILHTSCSMSMPAEMIAGRHAFLALLRGGEVAFNTLTIWRYCFAYCCLLLLSTSASGTEARRRACH